MNREIRRIEKDGSVTRQFYDKNGQLIKTVRPREYHRAGDMGAGMQYTYDAQGRILTIIRADGTIQETNTYDADGRLIRSLDGSGSGASFRYDFGGRRTGIETMGKASQQFRYDAWGNLTTCEEKIKNRFKYNGQQYDQVSGQYYLRARYYNPVIGRFTQEDAYRGDGLNLYAYCKNNPVYYVDSSGNICDSATNRIMDKFGANGECGASRNEQKKLAAYLRDKDRKGGNLSDNERRILNQIDDYTYLSRYDNQDMPSHLTNESGSKTNIDGAINNG